MSKKISILTGYSLIELLIVLAIFIILASFGAGAFLGFRETTLARESVQIVMQDVQLAQHKAMVYEREVGDTWVYGIGIDFTKVNTDGTYTMFKWCSPYSSFDEGGEITRSKILSWDSSMQIGTPDIIDIGDPGPSIDGVQESVLGTTVYDNVPNGYLPVSVSRASSCKSNALVNIYTGRLSELIDFEQTKTYSIAKYIVFEALTGRAFLYDIGGRPVNYTSIGDYEGSEVFDLLLTRDRSSKFDLVSVYPLSGIIIHHVYNSSDKALIDTEDPTVVVNYTKYIRYDIFDEINSYREEPYEVTTTNTN